MPFPKGEKVTFVATRMYDLPDEKECNRDSLLVEARAVVDRIVMKSLLFLSHTFLLPALCQNPTNWVPGW